MVSTTLKDLLTEYSKKREKALLDVSKKKAKLYSKVPELKKTEDSLTKNLIKKSKLLLTSNLKELDEVNSKIKALEKEKSAILKKLKLDKDYFSPVFECKICNDTGYITDGLSSKMCNCLKQKMYNLEFNKYNLYNIEQDTFDKFNYNLYSDVVDKAKYNSKISPRENIKIIRKICDDFVKNFDSPDEKNLLFVGNSGLGKTFLSNCIANKLLASGKTVLYQTAPVMLDTIINHRFNKNDDLNNLDIYNHILNVDLLVIDDLGTETINNMKFTELFTIINSRLLPQKNKITKTIISTNYDIQGLADLYGERIISRFAGNYNICNFFGDDIRLIKKRAKK